MNSTFKGSGIGASIGFLPGDRVTGFRLEPSAAEIYYHFPGKSKAVDQPPWYLFFGSGYADGDIYFCPEIGRSLNFSKRTGINLDIGALLPLSRSLGDSFDSNS